MTDDQLKSFGWRIPFLSGILIAFVACYLKSRGPEVHTNKGVYDHQDSEITNPIRVAVRKENRLALLSSTLTPLLWAAGFYVSFVWMAVYMAELLDPPIKGAFWINGSAMALGMTWVLPVAGAISDRVGRSRIMAVAGVILTALGPVLLMMVSKGNGLLAFFSQLVIGIILSFFGGPLCAWIVESFSAEVRLTSASMGYDFA
jgi:MHS family proline/betaine transporter-like MFS transporter